MTKYADGDIKVHTQGTLDRAFLACHMVPTGIWFQRFIWSVGRGLSSSAALDGRVFAAHGRLLEQLDRPLALLCLSRLSSSCWTPEPFKPMILEKPEAHVRPFLGRAGLTASPQQCAIEASAHASHVARERRICRGPRRPYWASLGRQ